MSNNIRNISYALCPNFLMPLLKRVEASDVGARLARGVFWSLAGAVFSRGFTLVSTIIVARILGQALYGELGMIRSTVNMFAIFAGFGLGMTATKHIAELYLNDKLKAGRILALSGVFAFITGVLVAAVIFFCAPWLAVHTINAPHLIAEIRIGALILLVNSTTVRLIAE